MAAARSAAVRVETGTEGDAWVAAGAVATGLTALFLLVVLPDGAPAELATRPIVAQVSQASAELRLRPADTLGWRPLGPGQPVRQDDAIFVPPGVEASVTLSDGTVLELDEQSLVVIEAMKQGRRRVAVRQGSVIGRAAAELEFSSGGVTTQLSADAEARLDVVKGAPQLSVSKGQAQVLGAWLQPGHRAALTPQGLVEQSPWPVTLDGPQASWRRRFHVSPPPVSLQWHGALPGDLVQVARDKGFAFVVDEASADTGELLFSRAEAGVFWWRVVSAEGEPRSEARRFSLLEDVPPVLLTPRPDEVVLSNDATPATLRWTQVRGVTRYRVEFSASADFATEAFAREVDGVVLRASLPLNEGVWWFRVRAAELERDEAPASPARSFTLVHRPLLAPPELLAPELEVEP